MSNWQDPEIVMHVLNNPREFGPFDLTELFVSGIDKSFAFQIMALMLR